MTSLKRIFVLMGLFTAAIASHAEAGTVVFSFSGPGVSGSLELTYGAATDATYPAALEVTGISGTFSDTNVGIVNATITSLVAITRDAPEATNLLAPNDFSKFSVASGLTHQPLLSYDNLYWPAGSPQTASDYPFYGGVLDIYGLLFNIGGGTVVNVWSNGDNSGSGIIDYGVAVATHAAALDYVETGVRQVPEPGTLAMLSCGLVILLVRRRPSLLVARI